MSKFSKRIIIPEIIDDFELTGQSLEQNLHEIEWINKYLGGTSTSAKPILQYLQKNLRKPLSIADIGCGSGDLLKYIQDACQNITHPILIGIDANQHIIDVARKWHFKKHPIQFVHTDVLSDSDKIPKADIYVLNLFLHHFDEPLIALLLNKIKQTNPALVVINDLHRSIWAYYLFAVLGFIKGHSAITVHDGKLSIQKGFRRKEMLELTKGFEGYSCNLAWKWAYRWQLVLTKN